MSTITPVQTDNLKCEKRTPLEFLESKVDSSLSSSA